jgi:hypothetical protein
MAAASGLAAVVARDSFDASVRGPSDIRHLLRVPALASIPVMVTAAERSRHKRITRYSWVGGVAAVILAAVTVHLFIKPLDVVWVILMRRFGI